MTPEKVKPISPQEASQDKLNQIPDTVIEAFNELLSGTPIGGETTIYQNEILDILTKKGLDRATIFSKGWLDVEEIYRKAGWIVEYDKPGYNETYEAHFTFRAKRRRNSQ